MDDQELARTVRSLLYDLDARAAYHNGQANAKLQERDSVRSASLASGYRGASELVRRAFPEQAAPATTHEDVIY